MNVDNDRLHAAISSVNNACCLAKRLQPQITAKSTLTKSDLSPVTIADYAVQALICHELQLRFGQFVMVGEEASESLRGNTDLVSSICAALMEFWPDVSAADLLAAIDLGSGRPEFEGFWTLDPIDGTKGFLRGGQYAISLAYLRAGQVVAGVLGCPSLPTDFSQPFDEPAIRGQIFYAAIGEGAWARPIRNDNRSASTVGRRISISHRDPAAPFRLCESVESSHSNHEVTQRIAAVLNAAPPLRLDSQCKYAVVARGQADAYVRIPTASSYVEHIWDHAAGVVIAQEAGARVSDARGNKLDFSVGKGLSRNKGVVCATPDIHELIVQAVAAEP